MWTCFEGGWFVLRSRRLAGWLLLGAVPVLAGVGVTAKSWSVAVAAALAGIAGVLAARGNAEWERSATQSRELPGLVRMTRFGRLPRVRQVPDPVAWGVHPAAEVNGNRVPAFVDRDVAHEIEAALRTDRFVLLVGESTAGKSRLGFELVRRLFAGHRLVEPSTRAGARMAARLAVSSKRCVVWLDDVERFVGEDGLNRHDIDAILSAASHDRYIVATIRAEEYAKFTSRSSESHYGATESGHRGGEVLRAAKRFTVRRRWSSAELNRARRHRADERIDSALARAAEYGVAEWMAAGPQLSWAWQDAWAPGNRPRGAAIVTAAVNARRAGVHRPLSRDVLRRLHEVYLDQRGGQLLRPEPFDDAMAWALSPLHATSSLLVPEGEGFLAFDYLLDAPDKQPVPEATFIALLDIADREEAVEIGWTAWMSIHIATAITAYERADAGRHNQLSVVDLLLYQGRGRRAKELAGECVARCESELGADHRNTLEARCVLAYVTGRAESMERACGMFRDLIDDATAVLGGDHKLVLRARVHHAEFTGEVGDRDGHLTEMTRLVADCERLRGADDDITLSNRRQLAYAHLAAGHLETALTMSRRLLDELPRGSGNAHLRRSTQWLVCWALTGLNRHSEALPAWQWLLDETSRSLGARHMVTMNAHADRADAIGKSGDPGQAVRLLREVVSEWDEMAPDHDRRKQIHRSLLAHWIHENGDVVEAITLMRGVVAEASMNLDPADAGLLGFKRDLAGYEGHREAGR